MGLLGDLFSPIGDLINGITGVTSSGNDQFEHQSELNEQSFQHNRQLAHEQFNYQRSLNADAVSNDLRLMEQQNRYNIDMFNRENEYNTPAQQRARMAAAGLNPNFDTPAQVAASGNGVSPVGVGAGSAGLPSVGSGSASVGTSSDVIGLIKGIEEVALMDENLKQNRIKTRNMEKEGLNLDADTSNKYASAGLANQQAEELIGTGDSIINKNNADAASSYAEAANKSAAYPYIASEYDAKIANIISNTNFTDTQKETMLKELLPKINLMNAQTFYYQSTIEQGWTKLELEGKQIKISAFLANHLAKKYDAEAWATRYLAPAQKEYYESIKRLNESKADSEEFNYRLNKIKYGGFEFIYENYPEEYKSLATKAARDEFNRISEDLRTAKLNNDHKAYENSQQELDKWYNRILQGWNAIKPNGRPTDWFGTTK